MNTTTAPADGWQIHDEQGFAGLIGPIWERWDDGDTLVLALTLGRRHVNQAGVAQGGLLVTLADRVMGHALRHTLGGEPVATIQLDTQFLAPGQVGETVEGRACITRLTQRLAFIDGTITCGERTLVQARGIWKRLADPHGAARRAFVARFYADDTA
ncbi:PaaI family thioesterase [uncultured Salinisphaera sp.]|uniref:PaaI family thioesterase n=1 Tax=uncultured Salinisphaera sp. TaxID=359372 RepID=UPI0032B2B9A0|tara:strand:+ start:745 stop:1215 length:471 start_codon:yes stop_codon:yes gene_type:complete